MAKNDSTEKQTRARKTPEQRAVADLDAAIKTRDLAQKKLDKLKEGVEPAQAAFDHAEQRVQFLSQNPDLPADRRPAPEPTVVGVPDGAEDGGDVNLPN